LEDFLLKTKQVKDTAAKEVSKAWIQGKKLALKGQKIVKKGKNNALTYTANRLVALSGIVTHPGTQALLRNLARTFNRGVTIEDAANTHQEAILQVAPRQSKKRTTNQVPSV
jgi:hypothetical protein